MTEPLPSVTSFAMENIPLDGSHPLFDRDDVHEIYRGWRTVFNEYDPPRVAVAEAWVPAERRPKYAGADELGQAFNFDLLGTPWSAKKFHQTIEFNIDLAAKSHSSSTWVLSNHDVIRHATRYGLPKKVNSDNWLMSDGKTPEIDLEQGLSRARAATMLIMALPGSTYIYQGEELGLFEVADIQDADLQDPMWLRGGKTKKGRDGCRVPLPWAKAGSSFGFGDGPSHLPQPFWFPAYSVEFEESQSGSTLKMYREMIALRAQLQGAETLEWVKSRKKVVHFTRPGGWHSITNFGKKSIKLPAGTVVLSSGPLVEGKLPAHTTAWITE